jgi:L-ribulose-5-phosphate 3-epimerase
MRIGIMQGRLVPPDEGRFQAFPRERWADELPLAREAELAAIEWIYDGHGADVNPIARDEGIEQMLQLAEQNDIEIKSLCADWFMEQPFVRTSAEERAARSDRLDWLIARCERAGIRRIVLPFVDASAITDSDDEQVVIAALERALPTAERTGVELHLETSLRPSAFAELLARVPHPLVRVNYDSGNSSSLGYAPTEELDAYGDRIGSFHLKDRKRGGGTVRLGEGDADLDAVADGLRAIGFDGDVILQVARDRDGGEVAWARANREYAEALFAKVAGG